MVIGSAALLEGNLASVQDNMGVPVSQRVPVTYVYGDASS